ncbi:hypothetical protein GXP67_02540 [Rhodocytophaga rosea]|uniref:MFS transporter n=1 Tax=Rhodocytophaga rosea TaxID=2704465 RepID=A0A6C0GD49_9BACT|nr:hypothetical protein [Rhodocytophaga rosea]QHT65620.1 hypothetical protein GXP67_02540 [Rhodocytophaga rosea]
MLKPAKVNYALGNTLAILGVAAIVVPLGQSILASNFKYFWPFAGIGVGMCVISIPLLAKSDRQAMKAIETYNAGLSHHFYKYYSPELKAVATTNGIGLMLHF